LTGEFGQKDQSVMLEVVDVAPEYREHGVGHQLVDGLEQAMRRRHIGTLQTEIDWTDTGLAHFFATTGFRKGPWHIIDCNVMSALQAERRAAAEADDDELEAEAGERDYSGEPVDDLPTLARDRVDVRSLDASDLAGIVRIDRNVTGETREDYMRAKLDEALNDSAIRVSLIAEIAGQPAGFLMARIDFGDFGRTEPVAVLDTIDVGPEWSQQGVATALLSQLLVNLSALQVEQLETTVGRNNFDLLRFLYHHGFEPSQRIALVKTVH
jgi:predicted N-acetyltransferase YhbS